MSTNSKLEELIAPLLAGKKYELVDMQYVREAGKMVLRVFIDKEGGINLTDCEEMTREIGDLVDNSGLVESTYVLEVSSPGMDRVLKKEADFIKFAGQRAKVSLYAPVEGQKNFNCIIESASNGKVCFTDVYTSKKVEIELDKIARARLDPEV